MLGEQGSETNSRIMVVDGSAVSREIVARIFKTVIDNAEVTACSSGEEALQNLSGKQYDLVTTSLMLSDMDGLDLCRHLRDSELNYSTPVIVISGDAEQRLLKEGFAVGVTDYFDKSQGYPAFGSFIKSFCQRNTGVVGRILYVEDSLTAAAITRRILERQGFTITHVTSAEEALALVEARDTDESGSDKYDIVITDFHLKNRMTGGDLLQELRTRLHYSRQELPVLIITGNDDTHTQIDVLHAGANDFVRKPIVEEVLMARVRSLLLIRQQSDALKRQARKMEQVAMTDTLTGVRNRHYMLENGEALLADGASRPFWAMIIDIDHFRRLNNTHGHLVGDHILAAMGDLLNRYFPDAMVVRFGGEEFAVLLPRAHRKDALRRAESVRLAAEALHPENVGITISIGIAGTEDYPKTNLNALLGLADHALDASKGNGRNRCFISTPEGKPRLVEDSLAIA